MRIVAVIITTLLITQVSASFFGAVENAMASVQSGIGNAFNKVVSDVKIAFDCTVLAVEYALSWKDDATDRFNERCGYEIVIPETEYPILKPPNMNRANSFEKESDKINNKSNVTFIRYYHNVYHLTYQLEEVRREIAEERQRLVESSELIKRENDKISNEVHLDYFIYKGEDAKACVDNILEQLKELETIEHNLWHEPEAKDVHEVIDSILCKLNKLVSSETAESDKIMKNVRNNLNRSNANLRKQLIQLIEKETSSLNIIKDNIEDHEKSPTHIEYTRNTVCNSSPTDSENTLTTVESLIIPKRRPIRRYSIYNTTTLKSQPNTNILLIATINVNVSSNTPSTESVSTVEMGTNVSNVSPTNVTRNVDTTSVDTSLLTGILTTPLPDTITEVPSSYDVLTPVTTTSTTSTTTLLNMTNTTPGSLISSTELPVTTPRLLLYQLTPLIQHDYSDNSEIHASISKKSIDETTQPSMVITPSLESVVSDIISASTHQLLKKLDIPVAKIGVNKASAFSALDILINNTRDRRSNNKEVLDPDIQKNLQYEHSSNDRPNRSRISNTRNPNRRKTTRNKNDSSRSIPPQNEDTEAQKRNQALRNVREIFALIQRSTCLTCGSN